MNTPVELVIVTGSHEASGALRLVEAATQAGYNAQTTLVDDPDSVERINTAEAVIFRVAPRTFSTYGALLEKLKPHPRRELAAVLAAFDKMKTHEVLSAHGIPTPRSYSIRRNEDIAAYPAVIKIANGNQGIGVSLLQNEADLQKFRKEFSDEAFLVQEYIEESKGTDKRLFVVGDTVIAAMQRVSQTDDFRANLHLGGKVEAYVPSDIEKQQAVAAVKAFGLHYAGVDIIESARGPLVLEVNSSPGFGIQAVSDVAVPDAVVKELMKAHKLTTRAATEADIERMFAISVDAHGNGYEVFIPANRRDDFAQRFASTDDNLRMFRNRALSRIGAANWRVTVAEVNNTIAGYSYAEIMDTKSMYIRGIFVDPRWQGAGVGGALFEATLGYVEGGVVRLAVLKDNTRARSMYEARGFVDTPVEEATFFDAEQVVMELHKK